MWKITKNFLLLIQLNDKTKNHTISNFNFHFSNFEDKKICLMLKSDNIFISIFKENAHNHYIKLLMFHIFTAFTNFNRNALNNFRDNLEANSRLHNFEHYKNELIHFKIFELFFIKYIIRHFNSIFDFIVKKEQVYVTDFKFKNIYAVELETNQIIFDLSSIRNSKRNQKLFKNEKLWQELMYHSQLLRTTYNSENGRACNEKDSIYRVL
jgi:hypothetical protein